MNVNFELNDTFDDFTLPNTFKTEEQSKNVELGDNPTIFNKQQEEFNIGIVSFDDSDFLNASFSFIKNHKKIEEENEEEKKDFNVSNIDIDKGCEKYTKINKKGCDFNSYLSNSLLKNIEDDSNFINCINNEGDNQSNLLDHSKDIFDSSDDNLSNKNHKLYNKTDKNNQKSDVITNDEFKNKQFHISRVNFQSVVFTNEKKQEKNLSELIESDECNKDNECDVSLSEHQKNIEENNLFESQFEINPNDFNSIIFTNENKQEKEFFELNKKNDKIKSDNCYKSDNLSKFGEILNEHQRKLKENGINQSEIEINQSQIEINQSDFESFTFTNENKQEKRFLDLIKNDNHSKSDDLCKSGEIFNDYQRKLKENGLNQSQIEINQSDFESFTFTNENQQEKCSLDLIKNDNHSKSDDLCKSDEIFNDYQRKLKENGLNQSQIEINQSDFDSFTFTREDQQEKCLSELIKSDNHSKSNDLCKSDEILNDYQRKLKENGEKSLFELIKRDNHSKSDDLYKSDEVFNDYQRKLKENGLNQSQIEINQSDFDFFTFTRKNQQEDSLFELIEGDNHSKSDDLCKSGEIFNDYQRKLKENSLNQRKIKENGLNQSQTEINKSDFESFMFLNENKQEKRFLGLIENDNHSKSNDLCKSGEIFNDNQRKLKENGLNQRKTKENEEKNIPQFIKNNDNKENSLSKSKFVVNNKKLGNKDDDLSKIQKSKNLNEKILITNEEKTSNDFFEKGILIESQFDVSNEIIEIKSKNEIKSELKNKNNTEVKNEIEIKSKNEIKNEFKNENKKELKNEIEIKPKNENKNELKNKIEIKPKTEIKKDLKNQIERKLENEIQRELKNEIEIKPRNEIKKDLKNQIERKLENEIQREFKNEIEIKPKNEIEKKSEIDKELKNETKNQSQNSSFKSNDDFGTHLTCNLSSWNLPEMILQKYSKNKVEKMFKWQLDCLNNKEILLNNKNLVYSAPTSAGKTLVAEILAIKTLIERNKKVIFVLPFVSVVREKMFHFQDLLSTSGIRVDGFMGSYHPPGGFKTVQLAICTIEKANSLINKILEENELDKIGAVIIDEMHLLGDSSRGYLLELLLTKLKYMMEKTKINIQIIGMSATLPNLELLSKWLNAELFTTDFRPIPLKELCHVNGEIYDNNLKLIRKLNQLKELEKDTDNILQLCLETIEQSCSVLIFCPTKNWCESLSQQISQAFYKLGNSQSELGNTLRKELNPNLIMEILEQLKRCPVGLDKILSKTISFGVAFHHAGLTMDERDIIEGGFRSGSIRILIATSTLSSGVNLPARRVIIRTPNFHGRPLDTLTYKQMIGRAGRMGKDISGESLLICQKNDYKVAKELMSSNLQPVESCLQSGKLKRAILEVIASGVACNVNDVDLFTNCTLLFHENQINQKDQINQINPKNEINPKNQRNQINPKAQEDNLNNLNPIEEAINFLKRNEFIRLQTLKNGELNYIATSLGKACLSSSLPPEEGLTLFTELEKARQCFVLETELHLIYLVTPYSCCNLNIDWMFYLSLYEKLPLSMKRVGELVGIKESFMINASRGKITSDYKLHVHKRFYTSLALQDLVNEIPLNEVASKFNCTRGLLQSLQQSASTFAGMVTSFSRQLGWSSVELLISQFQDRLHFGINRELLDLMRLPIMNGPRARSLFNSGIESLKALATSKVEVIENVLYKVMPFESEKEREGESKYDAERRNKIRSVWITGKKGLTEREAAEMLIKDARKFIELEMGLVDVKWENSGDSLESNEKIEDLKKENVIKENDNIKENLLYKKEKIDRLEEYRGNKIGVEINQKIEDENQKVDSLEENKRNKFGGEINENIQKEKLRDFSQQNLQENYLQNTEERKNKKVKIDYFQEPKESKIKGQINQNLKSKNIDHFETRNLQGNTLNIFEGNNEGDVQNNLLYKNEKVQKKNRNVEKTNQKGGKINQNAEKTNQNLEKINQKVENTNLEDFNEQNLQENSLQVKRETINEKMSHLKESKETKIDTEINQNLKRKQIENLGNVKLPKNILNVSEENVEINKNDETITNENDIKKNLLYKQKKVNQYEEYKDNKIGNEVNQNKQKEKLKGFNEQNPKENYLKNPQKRRNQKENVDYLKECKQNKIEEINRHENNLIFCSEENVQINKKIQKEKLKDINKQNLQENYLNKALEKKNQKENQHFLFNSYLEESKKKKIADEGNQNVKLKKINEKDFNEENCQENNLNFSSEDNLKIHFQGNKQKLNRNVFSLKNLEENHLSSKENHLVSKDHLVSKENRLNLKESHLNSKENHLSSKENHIISKDHLVSKDNRLNFKESHLNSKDSHLSSKENHLVSKDHLASKENCLNFKESHLNSKENHLVSKDHLVSKENRLNFKESHLNSKESFPASKENLRNQKVNHLETHKDNKINFEINKKFKEENFEDFKKECIKEDNRKPKHNTNYLNVPKENQRIQQVNHLETYQDGKKSNKDIKKETSLESLRTNQLNVFKEEVKVKKMDYFEKDKNDKSDFENNKNLEKENFKETKGNNQKPKQNEFFLKNLEKNYISKENLEVEKVNHLETQKENIFEINKKPQEEHLKELEEKNQEFNQNESLFSESVFNKSFFKNLEKNYVSKENLKVEKMNHLEAHKDNISEININSQEENLKEFKEKNQELNQNESSLFSDSSFNELNPIKSTPKKSSNQSNSDNSLANLNLKLSLETSNIQQTDSSVINTSNTSNELIATSQVQLSTIITPMKTPIKTLTKTPTKTLNNLRITRKRKLNTSSTDNLNYIEETPSKKKKINKNKTSKKSKSKIDPSFIINGNNTTNFSFTNKSFKDDLKLNLKIDIINVTDDENTFKKFRLEIQTKKQISLSLGCVQIQKPKIKIGMKINPDEKTENKIFSYGNKEIKGVSFSWGENNVYYLSFEPTKISNDEKINLLKEILSNGELKVCMFDAKEHIKAICLGLGVDFNVNIEDPTIADWILNPDGKEKNLQDMTVKYIPEALNVLNPIEDNQSVESIGLNTTTSKSPKIRSGIESIITWFLIQSILEVISRLEMKLFHAYYIEMFIIKILSKMELIGFGVNQLKLEQLSNTLVQQNFSLERKAFEIAGRTFSFSSSTDVAKILGLYQSKKRVSTNKQALEKHLNNPIAPLIIQWRKINSILTKTIYPLLRQIKSNRIYGNSITLHSTGRISMHEPNLQSVPRTFESIGLEEKEKFTINCRDAFEAKDNHMLISADYCQLELRILAHFSKDKHLIQAMRNIDVDVFKSIASKLNGVKIEEVTDEMRQRSKQICYGIIYGMGVKGLAEQMNSCEEEAGGFLENFHEKYPGIRKFVQGVIERCKEEGFVETLGGRRRYFENINNGHPAVKSQAERQAVNTTIQGSAADIVKNAMVLIDNTFKDKFKTSRNKPELVLHLHDELLYEVPEKHLNVTMKLIKKNMENSVELSVPFPVKVRVGKTWGTLE